MGINRYKRAIVYLFIMTMASWFLPLSLQASSRGISVVSDLSHQSGKLGAYRALIIGINDYQDPKIPDLETPVNDAQAMAKILQKRYGFRVELLLNRKATREAIFRALRKLASSANPDDSVLIYFAGHGDLDRLTDDGWWIPADAKGGNPITYLNNFLVQTYIRSMQALHVLLISDSCYSGTLFGQARAMPPVIDTKYYLNLYNEKSRWGMTSGNKTPVSDRGSGGHSVFAYQLLKELRQNNKPYISTQELYTRVAPIVSNNSEQTPICRPIRGTGDQGGEFVFVASGSAVVETASPRVLTSYLSVESNVSGARVMVDGRNVGSTSLTNVEVDPGSHQILLEKDGYEPYTKKIRFEAGRARDLYVILDSKAPLQGRLYVDTQPINARVRILNIGPEFHQGMNLKPGNYHMEVSADGYKTQKIWVLLIEGQDKTLDIRLDKIEPQKESFKKFERREKAARGWLGVGIQDINDEVAKYYGIETKGVLVTEAFPGDPADLAGIKPKDVILSVNGNAVESAKHLTRMIEDTRVGETIRIKIIRNGNIRTVGVKIAKRDKTIVPSPGPQKREEAQSNKEPFQKIGRREKVSHGWLGVGIQDISDVVAKYYGIETKGVLVTEVFPGDPADLAGIKPKDVILSVNGNAVESAKHLTRMIEDTRVGETIRIKIIRNGNIRTVGVKIAKKG